MRHQNLTELENLLKQFMVALTNQAYSMNDKKGFRMSWEKGIHKLELDGKLFTNYYTLKFFIVDKNESPVGKEILLLESHYPVVGMQSKEKLEEEAYKELLLNGMRCLYNNTFAVYLNHKDKEYVQPTDIELNEVVEQIKEEAKTKSIIIS